MGGPPEFREGSSGTPGSLGEFGKLPKSGKFRWAPKTRDGSGGHSEVREGSGGPLWKSGRSWEGSTGSPGGDERALRKSGRSPRKSGRGREGYPEVREELGGPQEVRKGSEGPSGSP